MWLYLLSSSLFIKVIKCNESAENAVEKGFVMLNYIPEVQRLNVYLLLIKD